MHKKPIHFADVDDAMPSRAATPMTLECDEPSVAARLTIYR